MVHSVSLLIYYLYETVRNNILGSGSLCHLNADDVKSYLSIPLESEEVVKVLGR